MARSKIEWLARPGTIPESWSPVTGCTAVSDECLNCWARGMARRLNGQGKHKYRNEFEVTTHPEEIDKPYRWRKRRTVAVNLMGDLFHEDVPDKFIRDVFVTMQHNGEHTFLLLTKRAERMANLDWSWPPNVWAGVTVGHPDFIERIDFLRRVPVEIKYVSFEPLLGNLDQHHTHTMGELDLTGIDWVIVGAETGPGKRKMDQHVVAYLRDRAREAGIPFFFKRNNDGSRLLRGRMYEEWPR